LVGYHITVPSIADAICNFIWPCGLTLFILSQFFLNLFIKCGAGFIEISSTFDEQIQKKISLAPPEQLSINYFSIFPLFLEIFAKRSDTTKVIACMKWVNHYHIEHSCTLSQWFLNVLPNQAWAA